MSYEGYSVVYCINGHKIGYEYSYDWEQSKCPICNTNQLLYDMVDETNGCFCDELSGEQCPAHELELPIIGYYSEKCPGCNGNKSDHFVQLFEETECNCKSNPCPICKDLRFTMRKREITIIPCQTCRGLGFIREEIYDISMLKRD